MAGEFDSRGGNQGLAGGEYRAEMALASELGCVVACRDRQLARCGELASQGLQSRSAPGCERQSDHPGEAHRCRLSSDQHGADRPAQRAGQQRPTAEANDQIRALAGQAERGGEPRAQRGHFDRLIQKCVADVQGRGL